MKLNFKKFQTPPNGTTSKSSETVTDPYILARVEWVERYGSYIQQAYNWRLLALLEAVALIIAIVGITYLGSQSKFVPYVVAVDHLGSAVAVHEADRASTVDERVVRAQLANWIVEARQVILDRIVEKRNLDHVYAIVGQDSPARGFLDSWYSGEGHSPFDLAKKETHSVDVNTILPISPLSYEIQWTETVRDLHGAVTATQTWEATCTVAFRPPVDEAAILANPLGLYITSITWTKKI